MTISEAAEDRSRWKEIVSKVSDGGQRSSMICRKEELKRAQYVARPPTCSKTLQHATIISLL